MPIGRRRQAPPLRPFLQRALGVAHGAARRVELVRESAPDEAPRRLISAIDENRADDRFADVGEDRLVAALARLSPRRRRASDAGRHPSPAATSAQLSRAHELGQPP